MLIDIDGKHEWRDCIDVPGVRLPRGYYFGTSSVTGDLSGTAPGAPELIPEWILGAVGAAQALEKLSRSFKDPGAASRSLGGAFGDDPKVLHPAGICSPRSPHAGLGAEGLSCFSLSSLWIPRPWEEENLGMSME